MLTASGMLQHGQVVMGRDGQDGGFKKLNGKV